jgi:hypothetical protein
MSFTEGMYRGSLTAKGWLNTYKDAKEEKRKEAAIEELQQVSTESAEQRQFTEDQGAQLEAIAAAKDPQGNPIYQVAASPNGSYTVSLQGGKDKASVTPANVIVKKRGAADVLKDKATIWERHGFTDKAESLGLKAVDLSRQDAADARTAELHPLQVQQTKGQIANQETQGQMAGIQLDEARAKQITENKVRDLTAAAAKGFDGIMSMADPDPNDGNKPEVVRNQDGTHTVMYGGKPMFAQKFKDATELAGFLIETARGNPMAFAQKQLELEATRARIAQSNASIANDAARLGIQKTEAERAGERWKVEKETLQAASDDTKAQREAKKELLEAIDSGDPTKYEKARLKAVSAGVKLEKPNNEFSWVPSQGIAGGGTLINKDNGTGIMYDSAGKQVGTIAPPGKAASPQLPAGIPPVAERKVGQPYDTPRGKMIWRGNGWEPTK